MVIIATLYIFIAWLVFHFKLLPWNWPWRIVTAVLGIAIVTVFVALLNYLTPSGRIVVGSRVVEVTPNVSGLVTSVDVTPNAFVKAGATLFQIERSPFEFKVKQLEAALAEARQKVEQLKSNLDLASADVAAARSQATLSDQRRKDIERLASTDAATQFRLQDATTQAELAAAQLQAAQARERNAQLALGSEINGENTAVAQLTAQLENAQWELEQTNIRAPGDGYVSTMALAAGARVLPARSVLSFILAADFAIVGVFPQNGFQTVKPGAVVKLVFSDRPGQIYRTTIGDNIRGVGQGQIAVSGILARAETVGTSTDYPAQINLPEGIDHKELRVGTVGTATVFSDRAGPIAILANILLWVKAYAAYL
ncbi:MAG: HlyD family secretion protein [Hyphomicrobiales bacterium]|nr:HlyD family secretion protein [Hyphomicrobiales bacterium]